MGVIMISITLVASFVAAFVLQKAVLQVIFRTFTHKGLENFRR